MELMVACRRYCVGCGHGYHFFGMVLPPRECLGNLRRVALPLRYADVVYRLHLVSCSFSPFGLEGTFEKVGPCCHLLAHRWFLFAYNAHRHARPRLLGMVVFIFQWTCAVVGTVLSFRKLSDHSHWETICFCLMGLSVLIAFKPLMDAVGTAAVSWIIAEGVAYITGAVFYSLNKRKYMHSVFHFFVLAGSVCHIIAVWDILLEYL